MKSLSVADPGKMTLILNTFSWLDEIRWASIGNYNSINYAHRDLTADEKLLTHWLCYITNRQMAFQSVFDVAGYVFSDLVRAYTSNRRQRVLATLDTYLRVKGRTWRLACTIHRPNTILGRYGMTTEASFASRYMPDDLVRICRTLEILNAVSGRSLSRFLVKHIDWTQDHLHVIPQIAHSLNQLTYAGGGAVSEKQFEEALDKASEQAGLFKFTDARPSLFGRKRLWCTLRDYLKSKEFNPLFVKALAGAGNESADQWKYDNPALKDALAAIELPGDVWNKRIGVPKRALQPLPHERASVMENAADDS